MKIEKTIIWLERRKRRRLTEIRKREVLAERRGARKECLKGGRNDVRRVVRARMESLGLNEEAGRWRKGGIGCEVCGAEAEDSWCVLVECGGYEREEGESVVRKCGRERGGRVRQCDIPLCPLIHLTQRDAPQERSGAHHS